MANNTSVMVAADVGGVATASSANSFCPPATGGLIFNSTYLNGSFTVRTAGTFSNLRAQVVSGNRTSTTPLIDFYKNGVAGTQQILLAPGGVAVTTPAEYVDSTHTDHVNAGDTVAFHVFGGGSGNANWTVTVLSVQFTPDNGSETVTFLMANGALNYASASETAYRMPGSGAAKTTTQVQGEWQVKVPTGTVTIRNLYVFPSANARPNNTTIAVNGATGAGTAPTVTVVASTSGAALESSNSIVANDGDKISFKSVSGTGTAILTIQTIVVEVVTSTRIFFWVAGATAGVTVGSTNLRVPPGGILSTNATEARAQVTVGLIRRISSFTAYHSTAGTGTWTVRANAAGAGSIAVTPAANAWATDTTNTYTTGVGDDINYNFARTTSPTVFVLAMTLQAPEVTGSITANAVIKATPSSTTTADAVIKKNQSASTTLNAVIIGAFNLNAVLLRTFSPSTTADAVIKRTRYATATLNAVIKATLGSSFAVAAVQRGSASSTTTLDAYIPYAPIVWTTPVDTVSITATPSYAFLIPQTSEPVHFQLQLDTVPTFDSANLRNLRTTVSQAGWEYWNGSAWVAIPATGVPAAYVGNEARYTVASPLSQATWYRRVRAGAG